MLHTDTPTDSLLVALREYRRPRHATYRFDLAGAAPMEESHVRDAAQQLLRRLGPLDAATIARELDDPDVDARLVAEVLLDEVSDPEGFVALPLRDGRLCDLDHQLEGVTLTHVLSDSERASGELHIDPDLMIVLALSPDGRLVSLADGTEATFVGGGVTRLTGPDGWLPDAPAVEAVVRSGRLELRGRDDVPEPDEETADRLDEVLDLADDHGWNLDGVELVIHARVRYPRILSEPRAPLSALLAMVGLRMTIHGVADLDDPDGPDDLGDLDDLDIDVDADPFGELDVDDLVEHLHDDHGFDGNEVRLLMELHRATLEVSNSVLRASIERIQGARDTERSDAGPAATPEAGEGPGDLDDLIRDALSDIDLHEAQDHLAALLADRDLTAAVIEDLVGSDPISASSILAMTNSVVESLRGQHRRANAAWLAARCLEFVADDHVAAERALRKAVELDPGNPSAAFELARYLSDRGEAGAALNLLRRIEGPDLDDQVSLLSRYTSPGPASAGRNEPCPCGSGRKHKVCCQARNGWPLQERLPWLWDKVFAFLASPAADELVTPIVARVDASGGPDGTSTLAATNLVLFEGGLLTEVCDRRGSLLPADELELLREWSQVRAAAYELVEVAPDDRLTLLDLTSGERVSFVDHRMAANLAVGDAFLAWLLDEPAGPVPHYGVIRLPVGHREAVLELLDADPDVDDLLDWYAALSAPPRLHTTAGDPLESITQVYAVPDVEAARDALTGHLEVVDDQLCAFEDRDGQRWLRGSVTFNDATSQLTVATLSATRAAWFAELIEAEVADARLVDEERMPASELARGAGSLGGPDGSFGEEDDLDPGALDPEVGAELEAELDRFMTEHEDRWLDTSIPALGELTPREAAADPTRRDQLDQLLTEMERMAESWDSPGRPMDGRRLRHLLGM